MTMYIMGGGNLMRILTGREAIREALEEEMRRDELYS